MGLEAYLSARLGRPVGTPGTPRVPPGVPAETRINKGAATRNTWNTAKVQSAANDAAPAIDALLARHGDASAGGVQWAAWAVTSATESDSWLVLTPSGLTLLRTAAPVPKPRSYPQAWPLERIAPWPPDVEDDLAELFQERAGILEFDAGLSRAEAEREAAAMIQRAKACWGCGNLRAATGAGRCDAGHRLVFRSSATRTWPGRLDARDCGDRRHD